MALSLALRPETAEDLPFLLQVYAGTREQEMAQTGWPPEQKEEFLRMQFDAQHRYYQAQWPDANYEIVLCSGTPEPGGPRPHFESNPAALGAAAGRLYLDRGPVEFHILDIALLPAYRNLGIGTLLLERLIAEAGAAGKPLVIYVERNNPARTLYDRLGFVVAGEHDLYLLMKR